MKKIVQKSLTKSTWFPAIFDHVVSWQLASAFLSIISTDRICIRAQVAMIAGFLTKTFAPIRFAIPHHQITICNKIFTWWCCCALGCCCCSSCGCWNRCCEKRIAANFRKTRLVTILLHLFRLAAIGIFCQFFTFIQLVNTHFQVTVTRFVTGSWIWNTYSPFNNFVTVFCR